MIVRHANFLLMNLSKIEKSLREKEKKDEATSSSCRRGGQFRIMDENNIVKDSRGAKKDDKI